MVEPSEGNRSLPSLISPVSNEDSGIFSCADWPGFASDPESATSALPRLMKVRRSMGEPPMPRHRGRDDGGIISTIGAETHGVQGILMTRNAEPQSLRGHESRPGYVRTALRTPVSRSLANTAGGTGRPK